MVEVLFDHNMPPVIARSLDELIRPDGHEAWPLRKNFDPKISDVDYFTTLGKEGNWIVISKDRNNARRGPERRAILQSGVLAFYLSKAVSTQTINEQAASIIWQWDKLLLQRKTNQNGLFELPVGKRTKFKSLV